MHTHIITIAFMAELMAGTAFASSSVTYDNLQSLPVDRVENINQKQTGQQWAQVNHSHDNETRKVITRNVETVDAFDHHEDFVMGPTNSAMTQMPTHLSKPERVVHGSDDGIHVTHVRPMPHIDLYMPHDIDAHDPSLSMQASIPSNSMASQPMDQKNRVVYASNSVAVTGNLVRPRKVSRNIGRVETAAPAPQVAQVPNIQSHTVTKGDTLYSLARKYGVTVDEIREANQLNHSGISVGQTLSMPGRHIVYIKESNPSSRAGMKLVKDVRPVGHDETYAVLPNDTLEDIAEFACVSLTDLMKENDLKSKSDIHAGQVLVMPPGHCMH